MDPPSSLVQQFFDNKNVFITGASGFIGKAIVEALLRSCPTVKKIYILLRPKHSLSVNERRLKFLQSTIFDKLRLIHPKFAEKVVAIFGDITFIGLGLSPEDQETLKDQVHVVFHSAATIKFNEPLDVALEINYNGTKRLLEFCLDMRQLVSFVHISTAYSNSDRDEITEVIYPMAVDADKLTQDIKLMDAQKIAHITPEILKKKPNTYTYTKALVECLLEENKEFLPITIIRPSIVTATAQEPVKGWIDNITAASGVIVFVGKGILTCMLAHADKHIDLIPVDLLVNAIIVAAWNVTRRSTSDIAIYNCCPKNPLRYKDLSRLGLKSVTKTPFNDVLRYPNLEFITSPTLYEIKDTLYHYIPAYLLDCHAALSGEKQQMLKLYGKVKDACDSFQFFTTNEWKFCTNNITVLFESLNKTDQKLFPMCTQSIMWQEYLNHYTAGLRKFTLHENDNTLSAAHKNLKRQFWIQKSLQILLIYIPILILIVFILSVTTTITS